MKAIKVFNPKQKNYFLVIGQEKILLIKSIKQKRGKKLKLKQLQAFPISEGQKDAIGFFMAGL